MSSIGLSYFNDYIFHFISNCFFSYPSVLISFLAVFALQFFVLFVVIITSFMSLRTINILILKLFLYSSILFYLDRFYLLIIDCIDYFY